MPKYSGQAIDFSVYMTATGRWALDDVLGKQLVKIKLRSSRTGQELEYCPTYDDLYELIRQMMEAENRNDNFRVENPVRGPFRPPEFLRKLRALEEVLERLRVPSILLSEMF